MSARTFNMMDFFFYMCNWD